MDVHVKCKRQGIKLSSNRLNRMRASNETTLIHPRNSNMDRHVSRLGGYSTLCAVEDVNSRYCTYIITNHSMLSQMQLSDAGKFQCSFEIDIRVVANIHYIILSQHLLIYGMHDYSEQGF
jgi:hypothetical protein